MQSPAFAHLREAASLEPPSASSGNLRVVALGIEGFSPDALAHYFAQMEQRLSIAPWEMPPNANNEALARGAAKIAAPRSSPGLARSRGCPMGPDAMRAGADTTGRYHHLANLYVLDGSLLPTSIGANPQLSIYGIVARLADGLAQSLAPARRSAASS